MSNFTPIPARSHVALAQEPRRALIVSVITAEPLTDEDAREQAEHWNADTHAARRVEAAHGIARVARSRGDHLVRRFRGDLWVRVAEGNKRK